MAYLADYYQHLTKTSPKRTSAVKFFCLLDHVYIYPRHLEL